MKNKSHNILCQIEWIKNHAIRVQWAVSTFNHGALHVYVWIQYNITSTLIK